MLVTRRRPTIPPTPMATPSWLSGISSCSARAGLFIVGPLVLVQVTLKAFDQFQDLRFPWVVVVLLLGAAERPAVQQPRGCRIASWNRPNKPRRAYRCQATRSLGRRQQDSVQSKTQSGSCSHNYTRASLRVPRSTCVCPVMAQRRLFAFVSRYPRYVSAILYCVERTCERPA